MASIDPSKVRTGIFILDTGEHYRFLIRIRQFCRRRVRAVRRSRTGAIAQLISDTSEAASLLCSAPLVSLVRDAPLSPKVFYRNLGLLNSVDLHARGVLVDVI